MKKLSSVWKRITTMMLAMCVVMGLYGLTNAFTVFAQLGADDNKYQAVYDAYDDELWGNILRPSEVYEKYGKMNGDYYTIIMEGCLMRLNGNEDVTVSDPTMIGSVLQQNGELPVSTRESLRKAVEKYDLDESMLPDDPDFANVQETVPSAPPFNGGMSDSAIEEMYEKAGRPLDDTQEEQTATPTQTPAPITTTSFADVAPDAWYAEAVEGMVKSGLIKGKDDGLFHPDDIITISEWCTLLYRITYSDALTHEGPVRDGGRLYDHWAAAAIARCSYYDYTQMGLGGEAYPEGGTIYDAIAHRGEALSAVVKILEDSRAWQVRNKLGNNSIGTLTEEYKNALKEVMESYFVHNYAWEDIPDATRVQEGVEPSYVTRNGEKLYNCTHYWEPSRILDAYNLGITNGVDTNGTCNPDGIMTRAQACKMLYEAGLDHCLGLYHWSTSSGLI